MGKHWTFVHELADVKLVLNASDRDISFLDGFGDLIKGMLPKNFEFVPRHRFFLPLMREANLAWFLRTMERECRPLLEPLLRNGTTAAAAAAAGGQVDLFETYRQVVMRMNLRLLFGPRIFEEGRYDAYYQAFEDIDPEKSLVNLLSSLLSPSQKERAWEAIASITTELLRHYQDRAARQAHNDSSDPECVLDLLVRQQQAGGRGEPLDAEAVVGDTFAFVFASFTNTYAVLGWCTWELAGNNTLRERFLAEARGLRSSSSSSDADGLERLRALESGSRVGKAIVDEVIRLRTPGLFFRKVVAKGGATLSTGERVPCGDFLAFSARYLATLPTFYKRNPTQFDVDRYFPPRDEKAAAGPYALQWGGGRHVCLGMRYAQLEMLVVMAALFEGWRVERAVPAPQGEQATTVASVASGSADYWDQPGAPAVSKSQLGTADKPTQPVYVRVTAL